MRRIRAQVLPVMILVLALAACRREQQQLPSGATTPAATKTAAAAQQPLRVVSWGGELQEVEKEVFFAPFAKESGARVTDQVFSGEYAKIQAQVQSGRVEWDVVEVDSDIVRSAGRAGLLEPIDYSIVPTDDLMPEAKSQYGVGIFFISTALTWNRSLLPAGTPPPTSWADLWDLKKYPGRRLLRRDPRTTLEIALLADGVAPASLYPLDVDRALRKLSQIKKSIVWWSSGSEFQQLILSEAALGSGWNGRVFRLQQEGKPVGMTFHNGILDTDWWIVLRGGNKTEAMKFIASTLRPERQRQLAERMGYGPVSKAAAASISPALRAIIPSTPENRATQQQLNTEWWAANEKNVREKWEAWLLQ